MRKIKLRYIWKRKENGKVWAEIVPIECLENAGDTPFVHKLNNMWELISRDEFTGLLDKHGKEIYERDIVKFKHGEQNKDKFYEKIETVSFWRGSFCLGSNSLHDWYTDKDGNISERLSHFQQTINRIDFYYRDFDIEVIGNIYEHSHLLK